MVAHVSNGLRYPLEVPCVHCGQIFMVYVCDEDMQEWLTGEGFIQDLMPYLSAGERELLISGNCSRCFDKMFDNEDDVE